MLALRNHLECWSGPYSKLSSLRPLLYANEDQIAAMKNFTSLVASELGTAHNKVQVQYYNIGQYVFGLWCDALETLWIEGLHFDTYFLVNDSLMALRESDEFVSAMKRDSIDLVSLNYWKYGVEGMGNATWLVQHEHSVQEVWRSKNVRDNQLPDPSATARRYPGEADYKYRKPFRLIHPSWTTNSEFWKNELVYKMNFPPVKVSGGNLEMIRCEHPHFDFASIPACSKQYPNTPRWLLDPCNKK